MTLLQDYMTYDKQYFKSSLGKAKKVQLGTKTVIAQAEFNKCQNPVFSESKKEV